ncbi:glycoside hydrolase/deacetylase [Rickenella mellea]|uniref:chitin deacetylase n=1 Tax=Rickenella mellea TaxID=50990 RepID=A0A4Y7QMA6_9AGAM|nr:glycoside hydrolase/deacetylase [Rickenella mellea]
MRPSALFLLPVLVVAHDLHYNLHARQAPPSASLPSTSAASAAPTGSGSPTLSPPPTVPVTLQSTNPTAVPLSQITANETSQPTIALQSTFAAGSIPTGIPGAPPLPNAAALVPANYPPLDKTPPTDSPQVQQWIQQVASTGISIPNISVTTGAAACSANPAAAADTSRCWWTCGGCTRPSDITTCPDKLTWGLTYDDGPGFYTPNLLQYLDSQNLKTTFFVIGSRALGAPFTLQTEYMSGHQIGVHTWSHPPLTTMTNEQIIAELGWTKQVIKDITGLTPNTFRPPYGDIDDRVRAIALAMGLTPIIWTRLSPVATFDTGDFNINGGTISSSQVIVNFENIIANATTINTGFIVLEHDLFEQTVQLATGYILPEALAHNPAFSLKPVINCLNKPLSDAYVETNNNSTNPPPGGVSKSFPLFFRQRTNRLTCIYRLCGCDTLIGCFWLQPSHWIGGGEVRWNVDGWPPFGHDVYRVGHWHGRFNRWYCYRAVLRDLSLVICIPPY